MPQGNLHAYAVQAEGAAEKLATGLAQSGADPAAVEQVSKAADLFRGLVSTLGKGQEQTADNEPPAPQPSRPETMESATAALHAQSQAVPR